jgi:hypothetical protein
VRLDHYLERIGQPLFLTFKLRRLGLAFEGLELGLSLRRQITTKQPICDITADMRKLICDVKEEVAADQRHKADLRHRAF